MSGFRFSFAGDDIDEVSTISDPLILHAVDSDNLSYRADSGLAATERQNFDPDLHHLETMLKTLPSRLAYSTHQIPLDDGSLVSIPRRELWDVKLQLMAAQDDENLANLAEVDVKTGVYEGGFKSWESSDDLVRVLHGRMMTLLKDQSIFLELGCGTALPSSYVFQEVLRCSPDSSRSINMGLADYNPAVLHLVTLPNLLLSWAHVQSDSWDNDGELEVNENLIQRLLAALNSRKITLSFFSGGWGTKFVRLVTGNMNLDIGATALIVGAETIYSQYALNLFAETITSLLQSMNVANKTALVAGKKVYFGVGGSMDEFCDKIKLSGGLLSHVREVPDGVRRAVVEVQIPTSL